MLKCNHKAQYWCTQYIQLGYSCHTNAKTHLCAMESHGMLRLAQQFVSVHACCTAVVLLLRIFSCATMLREKCMLLDKKAPDSIFSLTAFQYFQTH